MVGTGATRARRIAQTRFWTEAYGFQEGLVDECKLARSFHHIHSLGSAEEGKENGHRVRVGAIGDRC